MTQNPLDQEILEWLENSGYPLEMRVTREFRRVNLVSVSQARHFVDPTTQTIREVDVVSSWTISPRQPSANFECINLQVVVECKTTYAPWVVLKDNGSHESTEPDLIAEWMIPNLFDNEYIQELCEVADWYENAPPLLDFHAAPGYQVCEKRNTDKSKQDHAYAAVQQAASAAIGMLREAKQRQVGREKKIPLIVFPVVVITGPLYEATYDTDNKMGICEVGASAVLTRLSPDDDGYALVHIVKEAALAKFVNDCQETVRLFADVGDYEERYEFGVF